jgi:dTDP-4-dehydrorhamnose reductase
MKIALLGKNGQLGWELQRTLAPLGEVVALDYPEIDLVQTDQACQIIREIQPEVIVNATAYTAVDRAESEAELAMTINGLAPGKLAQTAAELRAVFIHYSTDYVFDGKKSSAYLESDIPKPLSVYGSSKLAGEQAVTKVNGVYLILRTSWVYSLRRDSFVTKVLSWARQNRTLRVVTDQHSNPTWARMLAEVSGLMLAKGSPDICGWIGERKGLYHLAGSGCASRYEWAQAIIRHDPRQAEQIIEELQPALTDEFPAPAQRPLFSGLDCSLFFERFGLRLPDWENALKLAMQVNHYPFLKTVPKKE